MKKFTSVLKNLGNSNYPLGVAKTEEVGLQEVWVNYDSLH